MKDVMEEKLNGLLIMLLLMVLNLLQIIHILLKTKPVLGMKNYQKKISHYNLMLMLHQEIVMNYLQLYKMNLYQLPLMPVEFGSNYIREVLSVDAEPNSTMPSY